MSIPESLLDYTPRVCEELGTLRSLQLRGIDNPVIIPAPYYCELLFPSSRFMLS